MNINHQDGLDEQRIKELLWPILEPIKDNYAAGPISRDRCLEALNALAAATALIIAACEPETGEAKRFFLAALEANKGIHDRL
jgi:hypothetical protein